MPAENLVGIHLHKAGVLADFLREGVDDLRGWHALVRSTLQEVGVDDLVLAPVVEVAGSLDAWQQRLHRLIDDIWTMEATGQGSAVPAALGPQVWLSPFDVAFTDPRAATEAASAAVDRFRAGDRSAFVEIVTTWSADPVFASAVMRGLGAGTLGQELCRLSVDLRPGLRSDDEQHEHDQQQRLVAALATAYATTGRFVIAPFGIADVAREVVDHRGHLADVALLASSEVRLPVAVLIELAEVVLLPLNASIASGAISLSEVRVDDGDQMIDARAWILRALAAEPVAAVTVVAGHDLTDLISDSFPYLDDGASLGDLLIAAGSPTDDEWSVQHRQQARRLIGWVAAEAGGPGPSVTLGAGTVDRLGLLAAPYVALFRDQDYAGGATRQPYGALSAEISHAFLGLVGSSAEAMRTVRHAAMSWAAGELRREAATGPNPAVHAEVGNVIGNVARARASSAVHLAMDADAALAEDRMVWKTIVSISTKVLKFDDLADWIAQMAVNSVAPPVDLATYFAVKGQGFATEDQAMVESLLLSELWAYRHVNGVFDGIHPPPESCLDHERLKVFAELSPDARRDFVSWIRQPDVERATGRTVLGDAVGLATVEPTASDH